VTVRNRILSSAVSLMLSRGINLFGQIVLVPVFATAWGAAGYGEWVALTAMASYLNYSGIGLAPTVRADMAMEHARGDHEGMRRTFQSAATLILVSSATVSLGFWLGNAVAPFGSLLHFKFLDRLSVTIILACFAVQIPFNLLNGIFYSAIASTGRFALTNRIDAGKQAVEFSSIIFLVSVVHARPSAMVMVYPVTAIVTFVINYSLVVFGPVPLINLPWSLDLFALRRLWRPIAGSLLLNFGYNGLVVQAPRIIIAMTIGPVAVAVYSVAAMLIRLARIPLEIPIIATLVEVSSAFGRGDMLAIHNILKRVSQITFWLALMGTPFLIFLGPFIVGIWTKGRIHLPTPLLIPLSLGTVLYALSVVGQEALLAANKITKASVWLIILAVPYIALCAVMSSTLNLLGTAIAVMLFEGSFGVLVIAVALDTFDVKRSELLSYIAPPSPSAAVRWLGRRFGKG